MGMFDLLISWERYLPIPTSRVAVPVITGFSMQQLAGAVAGTRGGNFLKITAASQ